MARPQKTLDPAIIEKMAMVGNPVTAIATILGCSTDTLHRRFAAVIKRGREQGNHSLRLKQYQKAMEGNPTMLIWLGKQYLGQSDKVESKSDLTSGGAPIGRCPSPQETLAAIKEAYANRNDQDTSHHPE